MRRVENSLPFPPLTSSFTADGRAPKDGGTLYALGQHWEEGGEEKMKRRGGGFIDR